VILASMTPYRRYIERTNTHIRRMTQGTDIGNLASRNLLRHYYALTRYPFVDKHGIIFHQEKIHRNAKR